MRSAHPIHEVAPDKAKTLAFTVGGKGAFAARVQIPAITMPDRSCMRCSLAETADAIREGLTEAIVDADAARGNFGRMARNQQTKHM